MSKSQPVIPTNMFSENLHAYKVSVGQDRAVQFYSAPEHAEFNARAFLVENTIDGAAIDYAAVLGNQHPEAVLKNLIKPNWTLGDLTDFSAFTIGDLLLVAGDKVYFCVGGSITVTDLKEKAFETQRGIVRYPEPEEA